MFEAGTWQQLMARWERGPSPPDAGALIARVERAAGWLRERGARPADRVVLQLPREDFLEVFLGALASGLVPVPLHLRLTEGEVAHVVADCAPRLVLRAQREPGLRAALDAAPPAVAAVPSSASPACILYTSGTTGRPKGAVILHRNVVANLDALHVAWGWSGSDTLVHALPLDHVHGLFVAALGALWAGASSVYLPRFEVDAVWDALAEGGTVFMGVPTFYHRMLAAPREPTLPRARLFTCGSAPLPAAILRAFELRFGHRILERYGMTEIGIAVSNPLVGERRPGSIGLPLPGVRLRVTAPDGTERPTGEVGELRIRGPGVFAGYHGREAATAEALVDGEMRTGDLGFVAADGYVTLTGRASETILVGGLNVYPREVEAALLAHPAIADAAACGVPDGDLGEVPAAAIVARPHAERPSGAALVAFLREHLAPFKVPRVIRWVDGLPRNAMGKVVRASLAPLLSPVVIRDARPEDAAGIAERNVAMAAETEGLALDPAVALAGAQSVLARDVGAFYLVAQIAQRSVGGLLVTREWSDWRNTWVWWIQSVYVAPDQRGAGVYRALYDEVIRRATLAGVGAVRLYVDQRNADAMRVYQRLGMDGEHYRVFERLLGG